MWVVGVCVWVVIVSVGGYGECVGGWSVWRWLQCVWVVIVSVGGGRCGGIPWL